MRSGAKVFLTTFLSATKGGSSALKITTSPKAHGRARRAFSVSGGTFGMSAPAFGGLVRSGQVFGVANFFGLAISLATGSHLHLDLIGTGAFVAAALSTSGSSARSKLSGVMVAGWATRLTGFLFYRATQTKRDARLEETLSTTSGAVGFWVISALWGWLTLLPHSLAAHTKVKPLGPGAAAAVAMYAVGLSTEVAADAQKWLFKQDPINAGKFCDVGVWQSSQHPNWFGNLALWSGIFALNAPVLPPLALAFSALSPVFLFSLFSAQANGSLTNALELADKKYGADPKYLNYKATVPLLFPNDAVKLIFGIFSNQPRGGKAASSDGSSGDL